MPVANLALAMKRRPGLREGPPLGESLSGCWAVRKTSPRLKETLDVCLTTARSGNVWSRLVVKYYGDRAVQILRKAKEFGAGPLAGRGHGWVRGEVSRPWAPLAPGSRACA